MNGVSTLMIDLVPGQSSSVTACVSQSFSIPRSDSILTPRDRTISSDVH